MGMCRAGLARDGCGSGGEFRSLGKQRSAIYNVHGFVLCGILGTSSAIGFQLRFALGFVSGALVGGHEENAGIVHHGVADHDWDQLLLDMTLGDEFFDVLAIDDLVIVIPCNRNTMAVAQRS